MAISCISLGAFTLSRCWRRWIAVSLATALALSTLPGRAAEQAEHALGRFDIVRFEVEGNTLLPPEEMRDLLAPHTGNGRSFADVRRAVAALEGAYQRRGYTLVQVGLPEQELNQAWCGCA